MSKNAVDIGLDALVKHARPGQTLSCREIADVCGCNGSYINQISQKAMKKFRVLAMRRNLQDFLED